LYAEVEGKLFEAVRMLESYKRVRKEESALMLLLEYLCFAKRSEEAQKIFDEFGSILDGDDRTEAQEMIFSTNGRFDSVLTLIRSRKSKSLHQAKLVSQESHALLKLGYFPEAEKVSRAVLAAANYSVRFDYLIINLEIACFHQHRKVEKPRLSRLLDNKQSSAEVRMCAALLLDDKVRATEHLEAALKKDKTSIYEMAEWAIWDVLSNKAWRTEFLRSHGMSDGLTLLDLKKAG
jgi:hypothetical protein